MASPIIPLDGLEGFMDLLIPQIMNGANGSLFQLFSNDYIPVFGSVAANFTFPPFGGYVAQPTGNAVPIGLDSGGHVVWQWDQVVFTFDSTGLPGTIFGYFISFEDAITVTTRILWAQRFDNPIAVVAGGQTIPFISTLGDIQAA